MNRLPKLWQKLTPAERLWIELFGVHSLPRLDQRRVLHILEHLPERQRLAVKLRFGFGKGPLSFEKLRLELPRSDGKIGISKELARLELKKAIQSLRHHRWRKLWEEAKV